MSGTGLWNAVEHRLGTEGERLAFDTEKSGGISYARLHELTAAIAAGGSGRAPVAILANRSLEAYVAVLACFRFGRTFVPLNPSFPPARLKTIVQQSGASECLFDAKHDDLAKGLGIPARAIDLDLPGKEAAPAVSDGNAIAYHLFTSGSTGNPKGVPITHAALSHYAENIVAAVGIDEHQRATQFFDLSFDLSLHDIFVCLMTGGTLVPASDMALMMPHRFVATNDIDIWFSVPLLAVVAARGQKAMPAEKRLKKALFCGEALPGAYASSMLEVMADGGELWNLYGPTEATIAFTAHRLDQSDLAKNVVPLGEPFGSNLIAILSGEEVHAVVESTEGELLLGGPQVFGGYRPEIEAEPFVSDARGERYYRTGDLVRFADGDLQYIGRLDSQVKIRGHRVELGEIESACVRLDGIEAAAALVMGDPANPRIVVAFQGDDTADFSPLESSLPPYMVPKETRHFAALPTNSNGKIDRRAVRELL